MGIIHLLDQETINKIAAGEVIERPASVVKELVENALDAGATSIAVEIRDGGLSLIRVTDNGSGIDEEDIKTAFLPHATSKIRSATDLAAITSLGFRGEALPSIAAVCRVEVISKTPEEITGFSYRIEGGAETGFESIGAPDGTTFIVKDIFYNTPARRKFLKTPQTEATYVTELVEHLALSSPGISFRLMVNGQMKLSTSGNGKLKDVIYAVYGREISSNLIPANLKKGALKISGFLGKPVINRSNKAFETFFVNGRYVKSVFLEKVIEDCYKPYMMTHKHPFCVLFLDIDPELVDVNVHPSKLELRFSQEDVLYNELYSYISSAISEKELVKETYFSQPGSSRLSASGIEYARAPKPAHIEPFEKVRSSAAADNVQPEEKKPEVNDARPEASPAVQAAAQSPAEHTAGEAAKEPEQPSDSSRASASPPPVIIRPAEAVTQTVETEHQTLFDDRLLSKKARAKHRYIGQLFKTYLLIEYDEKLYMIDQHAAHEKILFEQTMKRFNDMECGSQMLTVPITLNLSVRQKQTLSENMDVMKRLGFEIDEFGESTYLCRAVPDNLLGLDRAELLYEMLDDMSSDHRKHIPDTMVAKIASMSCKAAVKGNMKLTESEAGAIVDRLLELENPYFCPHGRPSIISVTRTDLEKKFKRIV